MFSEEKIWLCINILFSLMFLQFGDLFLVHCGRSGDADALFNLFYLLSVLCLYKYAENSEKICFMTLSGVMASMAFLCKSFHAVCIYGTIVIFVILSGNWRKITKKGYFLSIIFMAMPVFIWALWRYSYDGLTFLGAMFGVDVVDRTEGFQNKKSYFSFLKMLVSYHPIKICVLMLIMSLLVLFLMKKIHLTSQNKVEFFWMATSIITPIIVMTATASSATWYFYPIYILLILFSGIYTARAVKCTISLLSSNNKNGVAIDRKNKIISRILYGYLAITLFLVVYCGFSIYRNVKSVQNLSVNAEQTALMNLIGRNSEYSGENAYIEKEENSYKVSGADWEQADILVAELYNDFICQDGGVRAFAKDNNGVLYLDKDILDKYTDITEKYSVVGEDNNYLVLVHH